MTEQIKTEFATIGAEELLASLDKINKALGALAKNASKNLGVVDSVTDTISQLAQQYGEATDIAKRYFALAVDGAETQVEVEKAAFEAQKRINRMMREGADLQDVFRRAIIKTTKDRIASTQKAHQEAEAIEEIAKAEKQLAETKKQTKDNTYSDVTRGINRAKAQMRGSIDTQGAGAAFDINAQIAAEKTAAANKEKLLEDLDSIQEEYFKKQKAREDKQVADRIAAADRFGTSATKAAFDRVEAEEAAAKKAKDADDELLANRMRFYTKDLAAYYKLADDKSSAPKSAKEAEDELLAKKMQFYQKDLAGYNKLSDARIAKEEKEFEEKLKLAKKYLAYEQDLRNGTVNKDRVSNTSAKDFVDLSTGKSIVDDVKANPQEFTRLAAAIRETEDALQDAARAKAKFVDQAAAASNKVKEFTLSWQTMGRIIVAQAFNQAFFAIQNGIRASVTEAEELYKSVAEIQTIVEQSARGLDNYFGALETVLRISGELNFTPDDTALAFYESLSNQIGDSVSQIQGFVAVAGNLGKVTRSSLTDSADAISSVLNAYNLGASEAEEVSAILFAAVDKGRIKLEAIANHMGNVAVPAAELGVSFNKVAQSLAALTIAGITESEAMTLQRNVMFQLAKPTKEMLELFDQWGVSSGDAAIAAFGFNGVLDRLSIEADKGNQRLAELLGTIRGFRGAQGLIGPNFEKLNETFEDSTKAMVEYKKTVEAYLENPGEKFAKLQQEISNEFTRMGLRIVDIIVTVNDFVGSMTGSADSVSKFISNAGKWIIVLGAAGTAFLVVATAISALAAAASAVVIAFGAPVLASIAGVTAAVGGLAAVLTGATVGFAAFSKSAVQEFAEAQDAAVELNKDLAQSFKKGLSSLTEQQTELALKKSSTALAAVAASIAKINEAAGSVQAKKDLDDLATGLDKLIKAFGGNDAEQKMINIFSSLRDVNDLYGDFAGWTNDVILDRISSHEQEADAIQDVIDKLQEQRDKILDIKAAGRINLAESITERNINALPENQRGGAQYDAAIGAANAASNTTDLDEAQRLFEIARKFLREAEQSAFQSGFFGTIENHTRFFNQQEADLAAMIERRIDAEDRLLASKQESLAGSRDYEREQQEIGQTEIDRRKEAQTQFEIEKSFLEEYLRLREQIMKSGGTAEDMAQGIGTLNEQAKQGLDRIGASQFTRDKFESEFAKNKALMEKTEYFALEEKGTRLREDAVEALNAFNTASEGFGNTAADASTKVGTAINILNKELEQLDLVALGKIGLSSLGGSFGLMAGLSAIDATKDDPQVAALAADFEALAKAKSAEGSTMSASEYSAQLTELYNRLNQLLIEKGVKDERIERELQAARDLSKLTAIQLDLAEGLSTESAKAIGQLDALSDAALKAAGSLDSIGGIAKAASSEEEGPIPESEVDNPGQASGSGESENTSARFAGDFIDWAKEFGGDTGDFVDKWIDRFKYTGKAVVALGDDFYSTIVKFGEARKAADEAFAQSQAAAEAHRQAEDQARQAQSQAYPPLALPEMTPSEKTIGSGAPTYTEEQQAFAEQERARYEQILADEAFFGGQIAKALEQIAQETIAAQEEAQKSARNSINGVPYVDDGRNNTFNGKQFVDDGRNNSFNGQAIIEDGVNNAASWAIPQAMEQGAQQSIPQAMEQGSQSVAVAMQTGADAIGMSINQGMQAWSTRIAQGQNPEDYYNQGRRRFATGGPVGTDTIPAWLSKGEYVVNAQATKENFDYLQAINYGGGRRTQSNGGPVVNTQNFHSTFNVSSNNPTMQTTSIVNAMRRQISQGKATLAKRRPY